MTRIDFVIVENGMGTVQYKSGKTLVCGRGTTRCVPDSVQAFCVKSLEMGKMKIESDSRARFESWER